MLRTCTVTPSPLAQAASYLHSVLIAGRALVVYTRAKVTGGSTAYNVSCSSGTVRPRSEGLSLTIDQKLSSLHQ